MLSLWCSLHMNSCFKMQATLLCSVMLQPSGFIPHSLHRLILVSVMYRDIGHPLPERNEQLGLDLMQRVCFQPFHRHVNVCSVMTLFSAWWRTASAQTRCYIWMNELNMMPYPLSWNRLYSKTPCHLRMYKLPSAGSSASRQKTHAWSRPFGLSHCKDFLLRRIRVPIAIWRPKMCWNHRGNLKCIDRCDSLPLCISIQFSHVWLLDC